MNIDERIRALRIDLELAMKEIEAVLVLARQDGEKIRALLRIAESRQRG